MRWSFKIALRGFLTYFVFAAANWFGPAHQFLPMLYADLVILIVLGGFFIIGNSEKRNYYSLLFLCLSITMVCLIELLNLSHSTTGTIIFVLAIIFLLTGWILHLTDFLISFSETTLLNHIFRIAFILAALFTFFGLLTGSFDLINTWWTPWTYWLSGIVGISWCLCNDRSAVPDENTYRFVLLFSLSSLFDMINYFSLLAAACA